MPGEAHVIVGCGGSGIRTLRRLNELLSQDYYWRRRLENDIYYVVVDTDVEEMREFEAAVYGDLAGVPDRPFITSVQLSRGATQLQPLINQYFRQPFADGQNLEGQRRLLEHWWNRGPNDPFIAPNVTRLSEGAGQCPPVSYFLAWRALESLEEAFQKLIQAIQRRKNGFGRYDELNFLIVAGLAGGTGRGSWELVAFKLRELFGRYGTPPAPRAFLFDASLFQDVFARYPEQRPAMRANALTGLSQLSCWIANKRAGHSNRKLVFEYRLPSLANSQDPATDVLTVDLELDVNNAAPVNHAYLVFSENELAHLADHYQYYEMVGAGIYAALSKSSILRQAINSSFPYVGMATATYEVNAATLRRYFEAQVRFQATRKMMHLDEDQVDEAVQEFFRRTQLRVDVTEDDPGTFFTTDPRGLFLQKVLAKLDARTGARLASLDKALEDDDVEEVKRLVRGALARNDDAVQNSFAEVVRETEFDPYRVAESLARGLFEQTHSVANVRQFVELVQAGLAEEIEEMPSDMPFGREDPVQLAEDFSSRPLPLFFRHFDEGERKKLMEVTRRGIPRANYAALREEIERLYRRWSGQLDRLRRNAGDLIGCLQRLEQKFARERERTVPDSDDVFGRLFTDPARPESGLDQRFSARKFYRRELKPVLARGEDLALLESDSQLARPLFEATFEALVQERDFSEADAFDVRRRLEQRLEQSVRSTAGLRDSFMTDHFSLRRVVERLRKAWEVRLRQQMSFDERAHLEERFEEFFGFIPNRLSDSREVEYEFPEIEEFILNMAAALARTCKPYWKLKDRQGRDFKVALFVPTERNKEAAEQAVAERLDDRGIQVEVYAELQTPDPSGQSTANPFLLLAYSTQGTDQIEDVDSAGYFTDPELLNLLREAEDESGRTIFEGGRNGGIGYVDPLYVRNPTIRELRWRPWHTGDTRSESEERLTLDALLYALFPGETDGSATLEKLRSQLSERGWSLPLIVNKGRNRYAFTRLPLEFANGKARTDQRTQALDGWGDDLPVAPRAGLHHVLKALEGGEGNGNPAWRARILEEGRTFWETVLLQLNVARGTPAYRELMQDYIQWLGEMSRKGKPDDPGRSVWNKLLSRAHELVEP